MRRWALAVLVVIGATILGGTVLREPMASAASAVLNANIVSPLDGGGNVRVHEQGTASVSIAGTPSVNVANPSIATTEAGTPISIDLSHGSTYQVPDGKRLFVDFVSASCDCVGGQFDWFAVDITHGAGEPFDRFLFLMSQSHVNPNEYFIDQQVDLVVDPGRTAHIVGSDLGFAYLVGRLVDA